MKKVYQEQREHYSFAVIIYSILSSCLGALNTKILD